MTSRQESDQTVAALRDALQSCDIELACSAIEALWEIGNETAIAVLIQALQHQDSSARVGAAYALGTLGGEVAEKALIQALKRTKHRASILEALVSIKPEEFALEGTDLIGALVEIINSKSSLREQAIDSLGSIPHAASIDALETIAIRYYAPRLRSSATEALARIGTILAIEALTHLLQNKNWEIREYAVIALGACTNQEKAIAALAQALEDDDDDIRKCAVRELKRLECAEMSQQHDL